MGWVTIVEDDVTARMSDTERSSYHNACGEHSDKLPSVIAQVTDFVRGKVKTCQRNTSIGAAGTIPPECVYHAIPLIRHSFRQIIAFTEEEDGRDKEYDNAIRYFDRVADCKELIDPDSGDGSAAISSAICYGSKTQLSFTT